MVAITNQSRDWGGRVKCLGNCICVDKIIIVVRDNEDINDVDDDSYVEYIIIIVVLVNRRVTATLLFGNQMIFVVLVNKRGTAGGKHFTSKLLVEENFAQRKHHFPTLS